MSETAESYRFLGTHQYDEYLKFQLHASAKRRRFIFGIVLTYGLLILVIAFWKNAAPPPFLLALSCICLLYPFLISPFLFRVRTKKLWNQSRRFQQEFEYTVAEDGLRARDDAGQMSFMAWHSFLRYEETPEHFLVFLGPRSPILLPKRLAQESDFPAIRELLKKAGTTSPD